MSDQWKWYAANVQGLGDVAFEAQAGSMGNLGFIQCRKLTHFVYVKGPQGMVVGHQKWGPSGAGLCDEVGLINGGQISFFAEAMPAMVEKLNSLWSKLASNGGIVQASGEDLRRIKP